MRASNYERLCSLTKSYIDDYRSPSQACNDTSFTLISAMWHTFVEARINDNVNTLTYFIVNQYFAW
jgi:hypothetical protein